MSWLGAYAVLGVVTSLVSPLLLTERHESELKELGGANARVALCVMAGVVWPVLAVEYAVRGVLIAFRAMTRLTWLGLLNFLVLQWFGVRLARCYENRQKNVRGLSVSELVALLPERGWSVAYDCNVERVFVGYRLLRWIVPLTGWWSDYLFITRRRS